MTSQRTIVVATSNRGKIREISAVLTQAKIQLAGVDQFGQIQEPQETGETFAENARDKALYYARATGQWALADDSGLAVDALDGAPGVHSARYAADEMPPGAGREILDPANNAKLLAAMTDVPDELRTARFVCHLALASPDRVLIETFDTIQGRIGREAKGDNGFGYDPLFYVDQFGCTTAELSPAQKNKISHRGKALIHFTDLLAKLLAGSSGDK